MRKDCRNQKSEAVNWKRIYNTMAQDKGQKNKQLSTKHYTENLATPTPLFKSGVNSGLLFLVSRL